MIGDDIEVSVLAVSGDKVRLGIEAPKAVPVFRTEVWVEMQEEAAAAAEGSRTQAESVDEALHRLSSGE